MDQADKAADGGAIGPYDWQNTFESVEVLIKWGEMLQILGRDMVAESVKPG